MVDLLGPLWGPGVTGLNPNTATALLRRYRVEVVGNRRQGIGS